MDADKMLVNDALELITAIKVVIKDHGSDHDKVLAIEQLLMNDELF